MNPIILYDNVMAKGVLSATTQESGTDVLDIVNSKGYEYWQADGVGTNYLTCDLNLIENSGFETGDFTGWTANNASIVSGGDDSYGGTYGAKLQPSGVEDGAKTDAITIDATKSYQCKFYYKCENHVSSSVVIRIYFLDAEGNSIGFDNLKVISANQVWTAQTLTFGPVGSGEDYTFSAGTVSIYIIQQAIGTADGDFWVDDVLFYRVIAADSVGIKDHNFYTANATVTLESADSDVENPDSSGWTLRSTITNSLSVNKDKSIVRIFSPAQTVRSWRLKIVTANIEAYLAVVIVGTLLTFPNPQKKTLILRDEKPKMEITQARKGQHLAVVKSSTELRMDVRIPVPTATWVNDTFMDFWDDHASQGYPFFFMWDQDTYPVLAHWAWIQRNFRFKQPFKVGDLVTEIRLKMKAVKEE